MTWYKLSTRSARLGACALSACLLALGACDANELLEPQADAPLEAADAAVDEKAGVEVVAFDDTLFASAVSRRGIPMGHFAQPASTYGRIYNGGHQNFSPGTIVQQLSAIRARGGRVVVAFSGSPKYYRTNGYFSFEKWKSRVNRFRGINLSQFVRDGTIIGHYMIDEPNDPANWHGRPVPPLMLEQMARYSKQVWPNIATIVRVEPGYLSRNHRYLDAAWAQYLYRKGPVESFLRRNVSAAQQRRLGLVVGLNVLKGGRPNGTRMTASEVKSWGSALLNSSYPCAFVNWTYDRSYLGSRGMGDAMMTLRRKAENRSSKSCRA
jgi:hypothetical protein